MKKLAIFFLGAFTFLNSIDPRVHSYNTPYRAMAPKNPSEQCDEAIKLLELYHVVLQCIRNDGEAIKEYKSALFKYKQFCL